MGKGFLKFQRYIRTETCVQSLLIGASSGILVYAALLLLIKLSLLPLTTLLALIPAIGVGLLAGGVVFLVKLPTNQRIAKRLDEQLGLAEKVQTLVEYDGQEGAVAEVQRQDTEEILLHTPLKKVRKRGSIIPPLLSLISIALLVVVMVVQVTPPDNGPPPVVDPDFNLSAWQEQSLMELIEMVRASEMNDAPKGIVVQELESLLTTLRQVKKVSGMKTAVVACITNVSRTVTDYDTYLPIANLLKASSDPTVKALGGAIATLSLTTESELNGIRDNLLGQETAADTKTKMGALYLALGEALSTYDKSNTDPLYLALTAYVAGLNTISQGMDGTTFPTQELTDLTSTTNTNMTLALMQQHINEDIKETVVQKLMQMFGISKSDLPKDVVNNSSGQGDSGEGVLPDPDEPLHGGGVADGDMIYNSDDLVYDPETNTYVTYGTLLNAAYGKFLELKDQGALTPEEEKLIADYFNRLYSIQPKE